MRLENDDYFNFLFNEEFEKIPFLFRWSRTRFISATIIAGVHFICAMIFLALFNDSSEYVVVPTAPGYNFGFNDYNYTFLILMIACVTVIAILAGWMVISKWFEKRAFEKASKLSAMISISERRRNGEIWQRWKMENRDY